MDGGAVPERSMPAIRAGLFHWKRSKPAYSRCLRLWPVKRVLCMVCPQEAYVLVCRWCPHFESHSPLKSTEFEGFKWRNRWQNMIQ